MVSLFGRHPSFCAALPTQHRLGSPVVYLVIQSLEEREGVRSCHHRAAQGLILENCGVARLNVAGR